MKIAKIKIHYSLIFLLILSLFTGSFFNILGILVCIFLHELGHISMLIKFKVNIKYLELSIIGGIIEIEKKELVLYQKLLIDGIGVIINFSKAYSEVMIKTSHCKDIEVIFDTGNIPSDMKKIATVKSNTEVYAKVNMPPLSGVIYKENTGKIKIKI